MTTRISIVAALIAVSASAATAAERTVSADTAVRFETAVRFDTRSSAQATVGGRIINDYARVGAELPAPAVNMTARRTTIRAADGSLVPALVYDFE